MKIKTTLFATVALCVALSANAQKPFKEIGKDNEVNLLTLSNGRYIEYFTYDTLRQIGSVMFNTKTHRVEYFITEDDTNHQHILERAKETSRFMSVDPITDEYPELTPYQYASNRPIDGIDQDGKEFLGFGYLTDIASDAATKIGLKRTAGFIETYGHSLFIDPVYNADKFGSTVSNGDTWGAIKQADPSGLTSIPDVVETFKKAIDGDARAQGNVIGMVPSLIGIYKSAKVSVGTDKIPTKAVSINKAGPKPSPKFKTPTNPAQLPPSTPPKGLELRVMKPTEQYPNGYWVLEKPMPQGRPQKINPSTLKPGPPEDTHVPLPPKK